MNGFKSDRLYGQDGNDILIGVGDSSFQLREQGVLYSGDDADKFYRHAVIEDVGRFEDDTIVLDRDNVGEWLTIAIANTLLEDVTNIT